VSASTYFAPTCLHWKPQTGPKSPVRRCPNPRFSRNSFDPFPSQMLTPFFDRSVESVCPLTNQRSSSIIPRRNVFLVVSRGRVEFARDKRREGGAKRERVPVPVLSGRNSPVSSTSRIRLRYCSSSWDLMEVGVEDVMGTITTSTHYRTAESRGQSSSGRVPLRVLPYSRSLCLSLVVWELPRFLV